VFEFPYVSILIKSEHSWLLKKNLQMNSSPLLHRIFASFRFQQARQRNEKPHLRAAASDGIMGTI
jgi:hypothetical protein